MGVIKGTCFRVLFSMGMLLGSVLMLLAQPEYDAVTRLIPDDLDAATAKIDALYEQAVKAGNDTLTAKSLYIKGVIQYYKGNYYIAADYYERVLRYEDYLESQPMAKEGILNNLGICYEYVEDLGRAFEAYDASLEMAIAQDDSASMMMSWINLGLLATNQENLDLGEKYLKLALEYGQNKPTERHNLGLVYNNLAHLKDKQKRSEAEIVGYIKRASALFEETGDTLNWMLALTNQVYAHSRSESGLPAATAARAALRQLREQVPIPAWLEALIWRVDGDYWIARKRYDEAYQSLEQALTFYKSQLNLEEIRRTYRRMLYVLAAQGDFKAYAKLDEQSYDDLALTSQIRSKARYEELSVLHDVKRKEAMISELDQRVAWLDQSLSKALRTTRIQAFFLLLLLLLVGLMIGFTRQYRDLQWLQNVLFKRSQELDSLKRQQEMPIASPPEGAGEPAPKVTEEDEQLHALFSRIDAEMRLHRWYLNPQFGLKELSAHLNTNNVYTSKAINQFSGQNFSQYLNTFRVEAAKRAMEQAVTAEAQPAISTVALQSGFNSYNTFHRVFRAETGLTPSQYFKLLMRKPQ